MKPTAHSLQSRAPRRRSCYKLLAVGCWLRRGMTTLELLMAMFIFVIVIGAIVATLRYTYFSSRYVFEQSDATHSARLGVERLVRELREAAYADNGAYPLLVVGTDTITFYCDTDYDSNIEQIRYTIEDHTLIRAVSEPSGVPPEYTDPETVTNQITSVRNEDLGVALFTYYDVDSNEVTDYSDIGDIVSVDVQIIVNISPERAPDDYALQSTATLRNIVE